VKRLALVSICLLAACGKPASEDASPAPAPESRPAGAGPELKPDGAAPESRPDARPVIAAFGDSLSAGFGVDAGLSFPDFLQKEIDRRGYRYHVENFGISGDTTSTALARIDAALARQPAITILELGGNDGLRGLPISMTRSNLEEMIQRFRQAGSTVVLAGMTLPPNYGPDYIRQFEGNYKELAEKYKLPWIKFLLTPVALQPGMMQPDGIHPTAEGNRRVAAYVMQTLEPLLRRARQ
jgi:acyl-CoA thioesterase I